MNSFPGNFRVLCKNARLNGDIPLTTLLNEISTFAWDIICFSETHLEDSDIELIGGHRLISYRGELKYAGVAILIHAKHVDKIKRIIPVYGRLLSIDILLQNELWRVLAVYFPHAGYPKADLKKMSNELRKNLKDAGRSNMKCIIAGDFNTSLHIGERGAILDDIANEFGLEICNRHGYCAQADIWTFRSSMNIKCHIDYILTSSRAQVLRTPASLHLH